MKKTKDRFDLEQDIHQCWYIVNDINMLMEYILDNPEFTMPPKTEDVLANKLLGLRELYEMRFDRLWNTFLESHNLPSANKENIE
tara:strand:+ start:7521 stop:7775 length:255 start_codon:yes stop_codon:yes gene_type:complete